MAKIAYIYRNGEIFVNINSIYDMMNESKKIMEDASTLETTFVESLVCVDAMKEVFERHVDEIRVEKFINGI